MHVKQTQHNFQFKIFYFWMLREAWKKFTLHKVSCISIASIKAVKRYSLLWRITPPGTVPSNYVMIDTIIRQQIKLLIVFDSNEARSHNIFSQKGQLRTIRFNTLRVMPPLLKYACARELANNNSFDVHPRNGNKKL